MTLRRIVLYVLLAFPAVAFAQGTGPSGAGELHQGLLLFRQERFQEAAQSFRAVTLDARAGEARAEAYYWAARSYIALGDLQEAERHLEHFLANYPSHPQYPDALYQKGRLLYLQGDPESAIRTLGTYVDTYPEAELVSSGYFWIAESLYTLGHIDDAARVYGKIVAQYPKSVKLEAARYRLSLIDFKRREDQLMQLLQWSHEEALKAVEEFQRREKAYEQAIAMYQKKLAEGTSDEVQTLRREKAALEARLADARGEAPALAGSAALGRREEVLLILKEALDLKGQLLSRLIRRNPE